MSYDISTRRQNARSAADLAARVAREERERLRFIDRLDAAPFDVTDWEAQFIESVIRLKERGGQLTGGQRKKIDELRDRYEARL